MVNTMVVGIRASPTRTQKSGAVNLRFGALYTASARDSEFFPAGCFILRCGKKAPPAETLFCSARGAQTAKFDRFLKINRTNYENLIENTNIF
jgi:hypothetical protein